MLKGDALLMRIMIRGHSTSLLILWKN